jgi:hypothetical protein
MGEGGFNLTRSHSINPLQGFSPVRMRAVETLSPAPLHADGGKLPQAFGMELERIGEGVL